jgi:hypothetical protein
MALVAPDLDHDGQFDALIDESLAESGQPRRRV